MKHKRKCTFISSELKPWCVACSVFETLIWLHFIFIVLLVFDRKATFVVKFIQKICLFVLAAFTKGYEHVKIELKCRPCLKMAHSRFKYGFTMHFCITIYVLCINYNKKKLDIYHSYTNAWPIFSVLPSGNLIWMFQIPRKCFTMHLCLAFLFVAGICLGKPVMFLCIYLFISTLSYLASPSTKGEEGVLW